MNPTRAARLLLAFACVLFVAWAFVDVAARFFHDGDSKRTVELTILHWGDPDENAIVQKLVDRFEEEHPTVKIHRLQASDYDSKLKTMMAAGTQITTNSSIGSTLDFTERPRP